MQLAAIQMNSGADLHANLAQMRELVNSAAAAGAELVVLPENFALMSEDRHQRLAMAEADGAGPVQDALAGLADALRLWIVGGTIPVQSATAGCAYAACCVYNPSGERVGRYDKIHLFDVSVPGKNEAYKESAYTLAGAKPLVIETPWGRLGVAVCYDLRFPEQFRAMAAEGLDLVALPAAFTVATGAAHWELLLRARAVENLCYVVAAAQVGRHPGNRSTWGHSMIVDPWGRVLADVGDSPGYATATVDRDRLQQLREEFPVLRHRQ